MANLTTMQSDQPMAPHAILRIKAVLQRTGLTRATLYRKIRDGTFPKQVKISLNCVGWREADIDVWLCSPMDYRAGS